VNIVKLSDIRKHDSDLGTRELPQPRFPFPAPRPVRQYRQAGAAGPNGQFTAAVADKLPDSGKTQSSAPVRMPRDSMKHRFFDGITVAVYIDTLAQRSPEAPAEVGRGLAVLG